VIDPTRVAGLVAERITSVVPPQVRVRAEGPDVVVSAEGKPLASLRFSFAVELFGGLEESLDRYLERLMSLRRS